MKIKFKNLGFANEEPVWAVNLKADPEQIPQLVDQKPPIFSYKFLIDLGNFKKDDFQ